MHCLVGARATFYRESWGKKGAATTFSSSFRKEKYCPAAPAPHDVSHSPILDFATILEWKVLTANKLYIFISINGIHY